ncbi:Transcriptional regulatory protein ZraR [uncultured Eubacterium sp.]|uniref:sigma-54 interaction domain-containing protein n=1 Tax=Brotomerdimonas butyrica TaxID=2981721 RepID=UPI000820F83F|nr:sigma 54-interacting transcriptional regulator [Brotomerdimonas butyrica]SCH89447.1 Transcriptional regulatory protein ZraR [uncultured Eubacterium sp.]
MYKKFIEKNYKELLGILNCLKVGVYITDGNGKTLLLNNESCKTGGLEQSETVGKNMRELERMGFIEESVSLKTIESGKEEMIIQNLGDGDKVYVTGTPLKSDKGIDVVVCTERDITETLTLKELLEEKNKDNAKIKDEIEYLRKQNIVMWGNMIAEDFETKLLAEKATRVAKLDATVLLTGESGTGKEVFANFIYQNSGRAGKPFIKVNCAAIPENLMESELFGYEKGAFSGADKNGKAGLFEMANHGTLFLDEVGEIPIHLQSKLLRAIQEREIMHVGGTKTIPVDIRFIAATNRDLKEAVRNGTFRGDLYYRLNVMPIELMPLKGRKKDIKALVDYFTEKFNVTYKLSKVVSPEAMEVLKDFDWPGNIRELENVIERLMISSDDEVITKRQTERAIGVPTDLSGADLSGIEGRSLEELMDAYEKSILESMLAKYKRASDVGRILRTFKIKKNVEVTDNGKIII